MAVALNQIQVSQKDSALDKVLKGVQVAAGLTNIYGTIDKSIDAGKEQKLAEEKQNLELNKLKESGDVVQVARDTANPDQVLNLATGAVVPKGSALLSLGGKEYLYTAKPKEKTSLAEEIAKAQAISNMVTVPNKIAEENRSEKRKLEEEARKPPSDTEKQSAMFATRLIQAEDDMKNVAAKGYNPADRYTATKNFFTPDSQLSSEAKLQKQAETNFITAVLRKESGAAIGKSEYDIGDKQYFPRAGDTEDVLAQKQRNREAAIAGLITSAGPKAMKAISENLPKSTTENKPKFKDGDVKEVDGVKYKRTGGKWLPQ